VIQFKRSSKVSTSPPTPRSGAASCSTSAGPTSTSTAGRFTITGSTAVVAGERVNGTTKSGRDRVVAIDEETIAVLRQHKADQLRAGDSWRGTKDSYVLTTG
jgi:hypothetical protein